MKRTVLAVVVATAVLAGCGGGSSKPDVEETFRNPTELRSSGGELRTKLTVASGRSDIGGRQVTSGIYNGSFTPPVLRLRPGDTLHLELENSYSEQTNIHYHGLNVSPRINSDATVSDNIFVTVDPGKKLNYKVEIPDWHNAGMYWYHTHRHELAQRQVMGGLSGGLVIEGVLDPFPELRTVRERILLLKDVQITPQGTIPDEIDPSAPSVRTVNGQVNPTMTIRPNETQFLRIANIGSDQYYKIRLEGHTFYEIARDGNRHTQMVVTDELLLPPASRSEVLIQGAEHGTYRMRALAFDTGPAGDSYPEATLVTLVSQNDAVPLIALPTVLPTVEDFRTLPIARKRTITFDESADGNTFYVDSGDGPKQFDPNRIDSTIVAGTVEEWTVLNATQELHVFHIHQTDFQVIEINGAPQPFIGHQDNVNVSFQASDTAPPGQVKLLIDFRKPLIEGKFVYHCHILEHEDGGMMAVAEVVAPTMLTKASELAGRFVQVVDRVVGRSSPDRAEAARIDQMLEAVQAGSYCTTSPSADGRTAKPATTAKAEVRRVAVEPRARQPAESSRR